MKERRVVLGSAMTGASEGKQGAGLGCSAPSVSGRTPLEATASVQQTLGDLLAWVNKQSTEGGVASATCEEERLKRIIVQNNL